MDDLDLPPLPMAPKSTHKAPAPPRLVRKRTHTDYTHDPSDPVSATSSDPALFSGDETAPGAENYACKSRRKKKMYTGSWWSHRVKAGREDKKRELKRNFDSGVFMGSEGSELDGETALSSDSFGLEEELLRDQARQEEQAKLGNGNGSERWSGVLRERHPIVKPAERARLPKASQPGHDKARKVIQKCLDSGREVVDLSSMSLSTLPPEVTDLITLTKPINIVRGMLDTGRSLEVQLQLFLGDNLFTQVPRPALDLTSLRVLSLWRNNLTSIPPGIRNLVNLNYLNVSGNKLQYLPFELVELVRFHKLRSIVTHANPWTPLPDDDGNILRFAGNLEDESAHPKRRAVELLPPAHSVRPTAPLVETVLRQLSRIEPQEDLVEYMPSDTSDRVVRALKMQRMAQEGGGRRCTNCKRPIVWPGQEWLEWWYFAQDATHDSRGEVLFTTTRTQDPTPVQRMKCVASCEGTESDWVNEGCEKEG